MDATLGSGSCPYSYVEYEMEVYSDDEKDNLKIVEKGSLAKGLLDNEAEEVMNEAGEGDSEEMEVLQEMEKIEAQKQAVTAEAAENTGVGENEEDDDDAGCAEVCNLRSDLDLEIYRSKLLEADVSDLPPTVGEGEVGLYHIGGDLFVHVIERPGEEAQVLLQISQLCRENLKEDDDRVCGCPSLILCQDQWEKLLYMKKKVAKLIWSVQTERYFDEKHHIGNEIYISITHPWRVVNIRSFYRKPGQSFLYPSKRGIALRFPQYKRLLQLEEAIRCHQDVLAEKRLDEEFDAVKRKAVDELPEAEGNQKRRKVLEVTSPSDQVKEASTSNQQRSSPPQLLRRMKSRADLKMNLENLSPSRSHVDDVTPTDNEPSPQPPLTRWMKNRKELKLNLEQMKEAAQSKLRQKKKKKCVDVLESDDDKPIATSCRKRAGRRNAVESDEE